MPNVSMMRDRIEKLKRERDRLLAAKAARDKPEAKPAKVKAPEPKSKPKPEVIAFGRFEPEDLTREPQVITVERVSDRLSRTTPRWSIYSGGWWYNFLLNAPDVERYKLLPRVGQRVRLWWGKDPTATTARKVLRMELKGKVAAKVKATEQDPLDATEPDTWKAFCARQKANGKKPTWPDFQAEIGATADELSDDFDDDFDC